MSSAEEHYKNIREEIIKGFIPGDVLVFFYPTHAIDEVVIKKISFKSRTIIGTATYGDEVTKRKIPFDDFIKYGTLLEKRKGT